METAKGLVVVEGLMGGERNEQVEYRGILGSETILYDSGYMSLYVCQNP